MTTSPVGSVNNPAYNNYYNQYDNGNGYTMYVQKEMPIRVMEYPDGYIETYVDKASSGEKIGRWVASSLCPGLGQAMNGQWGKAAGFFFGFLGSLFIPIIGWVAAPAILIWSGIDAVKNADKEYNITIPKYVEPQTEPEAEDQSLNVVA